MPFSVSYVRLNMNQELFEKHPCNQVATKKNTYDFSLHKGSHFYAIINARPVNDQLRLLLSINYALHKGLLAPINKQAIIYTGVLIKN